MVNVYVMNNDIADILQSNAATALNVYISPTSVQSLVAIKYKLLLQLNEHVTREHNP